MNTNTRRRSDVLVVVFSKKEQIPGQTLAELLAMQINHAFKDSMFSVKAVGLNEFDDDLIGRATVLIVDKSLGHDLDGTDGIDLIARIQDIYPEKMVIAMSSGFPHEQRTKLVRVGVKFFLHKPMSVFAMKDAIEGCLKIMAVQDRLDREFWEKMSKK